MKTSFKLITVLLFAFCLFNTSAMADADDSPEELQEADIKFPTLGPNPQREYCMLYWNKYYKENMVDIKVTTEGRYDEIVVFTCPDCSLEEHYVEPFLNTNVDGKTGADKIKECGFVKAKFQGGKGIQEIEKVLLTDVQSVRTNGSDGAYNLGHIDPVNRFGEGPYGSLAPVDEAEPFESLDSVSESVGEASTEPGYIPPSEEPGYEKPLGVREAEGRPIGE
ncbi:MAG: hypothetical protein ACR2NW_04635 [Thermodesulfobacteriota bacterium]